jgi:hypothetical protein
VSIKAVLRATAVKEIAEWEGAELAILKGVTIWYRSFIFRSPEIFGYDSPLTYSNISESFLCEIVYLRGCSKNEDK